jgi:type IV pilus assembly protein PilM
MARWWVSPPPNVGIEIATSRVTAVSLNRSSDRSVALHATEPLRPGVLVPSLTGDNILDREAVTGAIKRVLQQAGNPRRVALVLPDSAAKVSMVRFDQVPARPQDLADMVRWQVRKAVPFPIDTAQVAFAPASSVDGGGREFVVVVMRRDIVESYERAVQEAGAYAGLIDLASFNIANLVLAADRRDGEAVSGDWLLVHLTPYASTLAIVRRGDLVFYRNRLTDGQESLVDLVHQTSMYYEDRLGGQGFARVALSATADALAMEPSDVQVTLQQRLNSPVELVDPRRAVRVGDRVAATGDELVAMCAPIGIVLREAV